MDRVILEQRCYLDDDLGTSRLTDNQVLVWTSGSRKSLSSLLPTTLHLKDVSANCIFQKQ